MTAENGDRITLDSEGLYHDDPGAMTLASGRKVNPSSLLVDDIDLWDIATSLSRQCRYNGHVWGFLSVARHSIWVSECLGDHGHGPVVRLAGLLHDAAEAYLGDMIRPLKHGPLGEGYLVIEAEVERKIADKFCLPYPFPDAIHYADNEVLLCKELPEGGARWTWRSTPDEDRRDFVRLFLDITRETKK